MLCFILLFDIFHFNICIHFYVTTSADESNMCAVVINNLFCLYLQYINTTTIHIFCDACVLGLIVKQKSNVHIATIPFSTQKRALLRDVVQVLLFSVIVYTFTNDPNQQRIFFLMSDILILSTYIRTYFCCYIVLATSTKTSLFKSKKKRKQSNSFNQL